MDLKKLNTHVIYRCFKMQSLSSIIGCIWEGNLLTSIVLKEAYLHIPTDPSHRRFLRFAYAGHHFQYWAMPFGLSLAPRTFTKPLAVVTANIRLILIRVQCYLDDILIQSSSQLQATRDLSTVIRILQHHGFFVNMEKSHLIPTTHLLHLGMVIDSNVYEVYLSQDRQDSIRTLVTQTSSLRSVLLVLLSQLLGKMISCVAIIPWACLHARTPQWFLLPHQRAGCNSSKTRVQVPLRVLRSLHWWTSVAIRKGCIFKEPQHITLTSAASLFGWGTHLLSQMAQGQWSLAELTNNINWLELQAVHLALRHFQTTIAGRHILILTDNMATKAHVNHEGGTCSKSLMTKAERLSSWVEKHTVFLRAEHILGFMNVQTDCLSRTPLDHLEWHLHPALFPELSESFGHPIVDLFAQSKNTQLLRFFS